MTNAEATPGVANAVTGDTTPSKWSLRDNQFATLLIVIVAATVGTLLVYPVGFMLEQPFWLDEAWVAVGTRAPLSALPYVSFPSPTGWSLLLRLPWPGGDQGLRLMPLAAGAGAVVAAFLFARDLTWPTRRSAVIVGSVTAAAVMLSPWSLMRQDLKQYTTDALLALLLWWLASRVESDWEDRKRVIQFALVAMCASVFSWTSMFVSGSAMLALFAIASVRREWPASRKLLIAGTATAAVFLTVYATLISPFEAEGLNTFWEGYFLHGGAPEVLRQIWSTYLAVSYPFPSLLPAAGVALFVLGLTVIARRKPATAATIPVLIVVMMALSYLEKYPFLDRRTSHFLLMMGVVVVAVGVGGLVTWVLDRRLAVGLLAATGVIAGLVFVALPHIRTPWVSGEDVRSQTQYVQTNFAEGDAIVVNHTGHFGFAYYWRNADLIFSPNPYFQFNVAIVGPGEFTMAWDETESIVRTVEASNASRTWLVISHITQLPVGNEIQGALEDAGISAEVLPVGVEPLRLITSPDP